ncbi:Dihydrodipicolinate synthase [Thermodesulfobium narugense DSM 14796]|uniref:Dihydrodipicolinate synthase n=1 Tax=Thermodesulfobium narugense DSM 14796 TaxID=747365 RepID=M1E754_9BACT|nr:dihydrodipicolinate synthase family protein [Thermodesulfobium narugense]AEE14498.1 Dihydrodipicolinate synthase [Thermodesulfobium narugense DSM 14796]
MFRGVYVASITILDENGDFDLMKMAAHIDNLINNGVDGILFLGSTGEFYSFSIEQKKKFASFAVNAVNKRVKVLIGTGSTNINEVIEMSKYSKEIGADGVTIVSPYYFGPSESAAEQYFGKIAQSVDIPIMLYNFPARTGTELSAEVVLNLAKKYHNIVSLKDTVDNISHTRKVIQKVKSIRSDFTVLSGFDEYYVLNRLSGGDGVLCALANVDPKLFVSLHKAYENKDSVTIEKCAKKISVLMNLYECTDLFVTGIKAAVKINGLDISTFTNPPGVKITEGQFDIVKKIVDEVRAIV